jgi:hypothetical protein
MISDRTSDAISSVRPILGEDAYLFLEDDSRHFIDQAVMLAISSALLQSFVTGLLLGFRDQAQKLGKDLAARLARDVEDAAAGVSDATLAKAKADRLAQEVDVSISEARKEREKNNEVDVERYAAASEEALMLVLRDRGYTKAAARRLASGVRRAAMAAVS